MHSVVYYFQTPGGWEITHPLRGGGWISYSSTMSTELLSTTETYGKVSLKMVLNQPQCPLYGHL